MWTENILKTKLFENDGASIVMWVPCPKFPQTRTKNDRWLLRSWIPLAQCERKTVKAFSERNLRFQIPLVEWGRGLRFPLSSFFYCGLSNLIPFLFDFFFHTRLFRWPCPGVLSKWGTAGSRFSFQWQVPMREVFVKLSTKKYSVYVLY